jgi:hypothetical protein
MNLRTVSLLVASAFLLISLSQSLADTAIVLVCGNAFGSCDSDGLVSEMSDVLQDDSVTLIPVTWGGVKWDTSLSSPNSQKVLEPVLSAIQKARDQGARKVLVAGESAGAWAAALAGLIVPVDGIVSFYGPLDLPTLWQRSEWGKINSPRGPILLLMPWGYPGCDNCNNPFPTGDGPDYYYDVNNPNDPNNSPLMLQLLKASPYYYFSTSSPPVFATQGGQDGIVGRYNGESQADHFVSKVGVRLQDQVVLCPPLAHGYPFDETNSNCGSRSGQTGSPSDFLQTWIRNLFSNAHGKGRIGAAHKDNQHNESD